MTSRCDKGPGPAVVRGCRAGQSPSQSGFTLVEMFVVLAILGFALALVVGYRSPVGSGLDLRGSAAALAAGLRMARSEAILNNRAVVFDLDPAGHRFRSGSRPVQQLPQSLAIELLTISGERRKGDTGDIRFHPDGSSSGGRISIEERGHRMMIGVDWLTGRVSIADARR
jgi:general secretion pathway protein H